MNTSTIEAKRSPGKRLGLFALALTVACAGMFGLASTKAEATATQAPLRMEINDALMNLGVAFQSQEILPAPTNLKQAPTNPLPNWWDLVDSGLAANPLAGGDPTQFNVCTEPLSAAGGNPNQAFPCGSNPANAVIQALGNGTSSTWNPTSGAISLQRVVNSTSFGSAINLDVRFPIMSVVSPTTGDDVPLTLVATGPVTGTYSNPVAPATGDGSLTLAPGAGTSLSSRVLVGLGIPAAAGGPQPFTFCQVDLPDTTLSTGDGTGAASFNGSPFRFGLEGSGAFQGSWEINGNAIPVVQGVGPIDETFTPANAAQTAAKVALLGDGTSDNPGACKDAQSAVNVATQGSGGFWMGNRIEVPKCGENQIGEYPNCINPKANISKIAVTGKKSVKKGKKVKLTVKVTNNGTADESVTVRLWSSNSGVASVTGSVKVNAPAGSTGTKKVTVKAKKKKGKTTIHATNGARVGKLAVKVK